MPYLTGIQWWWSQVSRTQIETFFPVRMPWRSGRPPQLLEMKKKQSDPLVLKIHILTYLEEELVWRHWERLLRANSKYAIFTVLLSRPRGPFWGPLAAILDLAGVAGGEQAPPSPLGWYLYNKTVKIAHVEVALRSLSQCLQANSSSS